MLVPITDLWSKKRSKQTMSSVAYRYFNHTRLHHFMYIVDSQCLYLSGSSFDSILLQSKQEAQLPQK